jgi:putative glutamine amidotransferase
MHNKKKPPLIGITSDLQEINDKQAYFVYRAYADAVGKYNGIPVLITYTGNAKVIVDRLDGLVITGGGFDIPPAMYGEQAIMPLKTIRERTALESSLYVESLKKGIPVLGVCGGMQLINVIAGGSLYQDIKKQAPGNPDHFIDHSKGSHGVTVKPNTFLHGIIGKNRTTINTSHHQAVKEPGKDIIVSAKAGDGIIEAIEHGDFPNVLGVQWHPERMGQDMPSIYKWLVAAAQKCM